jgi:hypothetical protein
MFDIILSTYGTSPLPQTRAAGKVCSWLWDRMRATERFLIVRDDVRI